MIYLFFNKEFKFNPIASGLLQASTPDQLGDLAVLDLPIPENGYLYVYVSNETSKDVEFDNLQIGHTTSYLIETNDYYPYGLLLTRSSALDLISQDYKYNGKELQRDLQFNVEDYGARHYDPVIGRWMQVDLKSEKYYSFSPFHYCLNNPSRFIDPDGKETTYLNTDGQILFKSTDNLPNSVSVITNDNLESFNSKMNSGINPNRNDFNSDLRNNSINYPISELTEPYANTFNDKSENSALPLDGKGPLSFEYSSKGLLIGANQHGIMYYTEPIKGTGTNDNSGGGYDGYTIKIHSHPNEGRLTNEGPTTAGKEAINGYVNDFGQLKRGDAANSKQTSGSGLFDIIITQTSIEFYNETGLKFQFNYNTEK